MEPDYGQLKNAPLADAPYPHAVVRDFLTARQVAAIAADFPKLPAGGLFMPEQGTYGPAFGDLLKALEGPAFTAHVGRKLGLDLTGCPTLVTLRDRCTERDGRIHADAHFKRATALLYINDGWSAPDGRLRILRSGTDLDDYAAEVPPDGGVLVVFKVQENSWHGHKPFIGPRRYVMVNWCTSQIERDREAAKHWMSGKVKAAKHWMGAA